MSRQWDTPQFWARSETDALLREYPDSSARDLARSLRVGVDSFDDDPELAAMMIAELDRRASAGVRFWTGPMGVAPGTDDGEAGAAKAGAGVPERTRRAGPGVGGGMPG